MSYEFYKVLHFVGLFMVLSSLGASALLALNTGSRQFPQRPFIGMMHGLGLVVALVAAFGLMARLNIMAPPWPGWVYGKLAIWLLLGGAPALIYRKPQLGKVWWISIIVLAGIAAYLARYKPF